MKKHDALVELLFLVGIFMFLLGNFLIRVVWLKDSFLDAFGGLVVPAIVGAIVGAASLFGVFEDILEFFHNVKVLAVWVALPTKKACLEFKRQEESI